MNMFVCPCCYQQYAQEDELVKHYLKCWKERHPIHKPTPAPRSEDIITRNDTSDLNEFIAKLQKGTK